MRMNQLCKGLAAALAVTLLLSGTASAAPSSDSIHVVQRGETLAGIASRYGTDAWTLAQHNGIANPNLIYVGQQLVIPGAQPTGQVHVVGSGETLTSIALQYGLNAWTIAHANGITNFSSVYVGQRLTIPGAPLPEADLAEDTALPGSFPGPWTAEYYDNRYLEGSPHTTQTDAAVSFDWGFGGPVGSAPMDYFSARWTGTFYLDGGVYRFHALADDGVRVSVDGHRIIDGWGDGRYRPHSADTPLRTGDHTVEVTYYEGAGIGRIDFWWEQLSSEEPPEPPGPQLEATDTWHGEFFPNQSLSGPYVAWHDEPWIGFDWGAHPPFPHMDPDHFSARWTRNVYLDAGDYRFCAMIDDGARIYLDRKLVLDEWQENNGIAYCDVAYAGAGVHEVLVQYFEQGGEALIYVWWEPAD